MIKFIKKVYKFAQRKVQQRQHKQASSSDFITWLGFANAGMLDKGNIYCFEYAIEHLPSDSPIIEIGSFCGLSTNTINYYLRKHKKNNKLISADRWDFEGAENQDAFLEGSNVTHRQYKEFVRESYLRNINFFSKDRLPFTIEKFSDDFFKLWETDSLVSDVLGRQIQLGGTISFAYIDGNHTYEFAKRDFENADKYLEPGGFILFDDSSDFSNWEVKEVIKEIKQSGKYEIIIRNPNYLIRKLPN